MPDLMVSNSLRVSRKRWTKLKACQMEVLIQKRERSRHSMLKLHSMAQHNTAQHSLAQHKMAQHSMAQHSQISTSQTLRQGIPKMVQGTIRIKQGNSRMVEGHLRIVLNILSISSLAICHETLSPAEDQWKAEDQWRVEDHWRDNQLECLSPLSSSILSFTTSTTQCLQR